MTFTTTTTCMQTDLTALRLVRELPALKGNVPRYREQMREIGKHLGKGVMAEFDANMSADICVVCTVEDADFLAQGVIDTLESDGHASRTHLICLWNERTKENGVSASPIIKQYSEPFNRDNTVFVIVKSIISGACVVKTNLTRVLSMANPAEVVIAAPVIFAGAEERLSDEFPSEIASKFKFVYFATHTQMSENGEDIIPGIGGSIYELVGLGDGSTKNKYLPNIVKERRRKAFPEFA